MAPGSSATLLAISQIQPVKEINKFPNSKFIVFVHRDKLLIEMTEEYMIYQGGLHAVRDPAIILCQFPADDGAYTEHQNGPRPVSCEINLRGRRLGPRALHPTSVAEFYIEFSLLPVAPRSYKYVQRDPLRGGDTFDARRHGNWLDKK